jgi:hypothetical protein
MVQGGRFCTKCGYDSYTPPIVVQGGYEQTMNRPQYYQQPIPIVVTQASGSRKAFWLGLIGGIIGIIVALGVGFIGSLGEAFGETDQGLYILAFLAFVFSIMGMIGCFLESHRLAGGITMIIAGIGILVSTSMFGALSAILFVIGGILMISDSRKVGMIGPAR